MIRASVIRCSASGVIALSALSACSSTPGIEQVTGLDPYEITQGIRCEMQFALRDKTAKLIEYFGRSNERELSNAHLLRIGKIKLKDLTSRREDPVSSAFLKKYAYSAIVYEFTIDITEDNTSGVTLDALGVYTHRTTGLDFKISSDLSRQNIVHFYLTDYFGDLIDDNNLNCSNFRQEDKNLVYPIAGKIGVDKQLKQFLDINESQHLSFGGSDLKVPTYAVTYNFQTTFNSSIEPKINIVPVGRGQHFQNSIFDLGASRKDYHKVVIAMAFPLDDKPPKRVFAASGVVISPFVPLPDIGISSFQQQRAYQAVQDTKVNQYLNNHSQ